MKKRIDVLDGNCNIIPQAKPVVESGVLGYYLSNNRWFGLREDGTEFEASENVVKYGINHRANRVIALLKQRAELIASAKRAVEFLEANGWVGGDIVDDLKAAATRGE